MDPRMADRNALGMIGLLFGATTLFVMMMGAVVVADHLSGKLHLEDGLAVAQLQSGTRAPRSSTSAYASRSV